MRAHEFLIESRPRTLYHGTLKSNIPSIEQYGLEPRVGEFTSHFYDPDEDELEELVFASSKGEIQKGLNAIIHLLKMNGIPSTPENVIRYGAMIVIKDEFADFEHRPVNDFNYYGEYPRQVEPGDFYSRNNVGHNFILQNRKLRDLLRREGFDAWMGTKHPRLNKTNESLTTVCPISIESDYVDDFTASFTTTSGINYAVRIEEVGDGEVEIQFYNTDADSGKQQTVTNTGDAFSVIATVIDITRRYIKKYRPIKIEFTAEEPSRVKVYRALSKRLVSLLPSFDFEERNLGTQVVFSFSKA